MVVVVEEEVVVIEALEGAAGLPAVTFSRLHLEWNNCPHTWNWHSGPLHHHHYIMRWCRVGNMAQGHWAFGHSAFGHWALGHVEIHVQMLNVLMLNVPMLNVPESSMQHKVTRKKEQTFPLCCNFSKICVSWQNVCFLGKTPLVAKCRL